MLFLLEVWHGCSRHFLNVGIVDQTILLSPPPFLVTFSPTRTVHIFIHRVCSHFCTHRDPPAQSCTSCILPLPLFLPQTRRHTHTHNRQPNYTQKLLRAFSRGYLHVYLFVFYQIFDLCLRLTGSAPWQVPGKAFGST